MKTRPLLLPKQDWQISKINFKLQLKFQHTTNESDTGFTPSSGLKTDVIS